MNNSVNNNTDIDYIKSDNILQDIQQTQRFARQTINIAVVQRNCLLGKRIVEEELQSENRAKYEMWSVRTLQRNIFSSILSPVKIAKTIILNNLLLQKKYIN
ncbi:MAG: hypothetical protein LBF59_09810 [Prevotellaceae bacterium]|jgi:hypothetical protein|nr:hypothetical protein [Prevotellaceae bacterium]